jgi:hypothetical protein
MPLVLANRVQETGTANTTVSFTLTGAVPGFQSFATIGNTNTTYYSATDGSSNWEVGLGTYSTTGPTLTRTTIYASSNAGSAVTFSGVVSVFVTYPSGRSVNLDASGNVSALGTVASGTWQGSTIGVAYGGTGVTTSTGANSVVLRDANGNITVNRISQELQTITASGGTTVLTAASDFNQQLVGTGGHTYRLPDATTLTDTTAFQFNNNATGTLTIQNNASAVIGTVAPGGAAGIALMSNATVAGTWDVHGYIPENVTWGTNALALGTTVISGGTWQGGTIQSGYGGTGLTTFAGANNALYSTSASALAAGTLPVAAGGTGTSTPSLVAGTNVTISGSFPNQTINASGGGLTQFTAAESTTAPNATVYVDSLTAAAASTDADVAFVAKGTGATLAQVPDSTTIGGNKRGTYATDWQKLRITNSEVAAGLGSTISGGVRNTASANYSVAGGGFANIASGQYSFVGSGFNNTCSGSYSIIGGGYQSTLSGNQAVICGGETNSSSQAYTFIGGGKQNTANSNTYAVIVGGGNNIASGQYSFVGGGGDGVTAANRNTASGNWSCVTSGQSNTASGLYSSVVGGQSNSGSANFSSVVGGYTNTASQTASGVFCGNNNTASGSNSGVLSGTFNTASGNSSVVLGGDTNLANGENSAVIGAKSGTNRSIAGAVTFAATVVPVANFVGISQTTTLLLGRQTTDATATRLTSNTVAAGTTNQVILPNNSAYYVKGSIIATVTGGGDTKSWDFIATIKRGANAAATSIVGAVTLNVQAADAGASTWVVAITADTTNGGLAVTVTGQASTTIRWVAKLESTEVTF